jgi:hypothetical protein
MSAMSIIEVCLKLRKGQSVHIPAMFVQDLTDLLNVLAFLKESKHD